METRANYVAVGAFVLAMVVLAFAAVLWLTRGALTQQFANYYIYFEGPVTGLRGGAEVDYNGVPVGKVTDVRIDPDNVEKIRVTVEVNADVAIKTDARASVETNILSGVSYIQILGGTQEAPLLGATGNQRYPVIKARRSQFAALSARAPQLLANLIAATDRLNTVLSEKNRQALAESLENLRVFTAGLPAIDQGVGQFVDNANTAAQKLTTLLDDVDRSYAGPGGIGKQMSTTIEDFHRVARNLNNTNHQLQQALGDVQPGLRAFSQQTVPAVGNLVSETRQLVSGLNRVTVEIGHDPSRILFGDRREGYRPQ